MPEGLTIVIAEGIAYVQTIQLPFLDQWLAVCRLPWTVLLVNCSKFASLEPTTPLSFELTIREMICEQVQDYTEAVLTACGCCN